MTPLERAARALHEATRQVRYIRDCTQPALPPAEHAMPFTEWADLTDAVRSGYTGLARAVIGAIREPIADASVYLKADAEAWELGAKDAPHEVYLMESGRLRRSIAERLDALLAEGA